MPLTNKQARILEKLEEVWVKNPDMRFCQLVENLAKKHGNGCCIFHVENLDFERSMDKPWWE